MVQIVTLTGTLTDTGEDGVTTVGFGDVVLSFFVSIFPLLADFGSTYDQFLNKHSLSDTCTAKETNLTTTSVRGQKIDDLNAGDQDFCRGGLLNEFGGFGVDRLVLGGFDGTSLIDGITSHVHDTTKNARAYRNLDGGSSVHCCVTTNKTFGTCDRSVRCYLKA